MRRRRRWRWSRSYDFNPRIPQGMRRSDPVRIRRAPLYFNPRIPQGMRPGRIISISESGKISIHAFRRECDHHRDPLFMFFCHRFQSTHSAGNATVNDMGKRLLIVISIHAFRRECDFLPLSDKPFSFVISIHAFRRECDSANSILPGHKYISIHTFRRECDMCH